MRKNTVHVQVNLPIHCECLVLFNAPTLRIDLDPSIQCRHVEETQLGFTFFVGPTGEDLCIHPLRNTGFDSPFAFEDPWGFLGQQIVPTDFVTRLVMSFSGLGCGRLGESGSRTWLRVRVDSPTGQGPLGSWLVQKKTPQ